MGFGDFLKEVGKVALDNARELNDQMNEYRDKWEGKYSMMSDEQLQEERRKFRDGKIYNSQTEKTVRMAMLSKELRDRGLIG